MTIAEWIAATTSEFTSAQLDSARLDAELLLAHALGVKRIWLHTHHTTEITPTPSAKGPSSSNLRSVKSARGRTPSNDARIEVDFVQLNRLVRRRLAHEPIAYIIGKQEFYGREFTVSPDTLTPRPETETMIELALKIIPTDTPPLTKLAIIDVGTGSGCIAISTALELQKRGFNQADYYALDISETALRIARQNAREHKTKITFVQLDIQTRSILEILNNDYSALCILANLPYVPNKFHINTAATHEPRLAIFGGEDGLDLYRTLCAQLTNSEVPIWLFTEALPTQHETLATVCHTNNLHLRTTDDFIQLFTKD